MKNKIFGVYPSCDHINNTIRYINEGNNEKAISELAFAIEKADGYFHNDVKEIVDNIKKR